MSLQLKAGSSALALFVVLASAPAVWADTVVYENNIESGPVAISGVSSVLYGPLSNGANAVGGNVQSVNGYSGIGSAGQHFAGAMVVNDRTGGAAEAIVLQLSDLPTHTHVSLGFLLAVIDSWDGSGGPNGFQPDYMNVMVDGVSVFSETFDNMFGTTFGVSQSYVPPPGGLLVYPSSRTGSGYPDSAYNMHLESRLQNIAHTGNTATIRIFANGAGYQGSSDESFGVDNLRVSIDNVAPVPLPAAAWGGIALFGLIGATRLRRRNLKGA